MITQKHDLDVTPSGVLPVVNASQYDVGRIIKFYLYNESEVYNIPVGTSVLVNGIKPNGDAFSYSATYTDNVVTVTLTDQMTVIDGEVKCELRFADTLGNDIGTTNFILLVERAPFDASIPISETEIPAIIELARAEQYNAEAWAVGERDGIPVDPTDPTYHNNAKYWSENAQHGSLDALADVEITTPSDGQALLYDAANDEWVNGDVSAVASLDDLTDTDITTPTNGQVLSYDDVNGKWVNDDLPNIPDELSDLSDVSFASPSNGQVMTYNGTSQKWENKDIPSDTVTQEIIAPVEGATSLHAYAVGKQLIYNDTLYKVIAPIAVNDALVVDTNIEVSPKTVIEQVEDNAEGIEELYDAWQENGAYNLCPNNASTSAGAGGITFTVNSNKTISTSGTMANDATVQYKTCITGLKLSARRYRGVGCPSGGSSSTYHTLFVVKHNGVNTSYFDTGDGVLFDVADGDEVSVYGARFDTGFRGQSADGLIFKPMITTDLNATYDDYVPYAMTNRELTKGAARTASITIDGTVVKTDRTSHVYYDLINRTCTFDLQLTVGTYANYSNFVTGLPRPKSANIFPCVCLNSSRNIGIATLTDSGTTGQMYFTGLSTAPNFVTNDQITITGTYIISDAVIS